MLRMHESDRVVNFVPTRLPGSPDMSIDPAILAAK
jgi:hypothetical protein